MHLFFAVVLALLLTACAGQAAPLSTDPTPAPTAEPTTAPNAADITRPLMTTEPTTLAPIPLRLWWPEPLAPVDNRDAADLLSEQISAFQTAHPQVAVEFQLKSVEETGGIMSTLRTASAVAPGALPDVTLLRRDDLLRAVELGLVTPLDGRLPSGALDGLPPLVVELARVNGRLYGLPLTLEVQHMAVQPDVETAWNFEALLDSRMQFVFPGGRPTTLSNLFNVQYLDGQGRLGEPASSSDALESEVLRPILDFYAQAVELDLIPSAALEYDSLDNYETQLVSGDLSAGLLDSTAYLRLRAQGVGLEAAPLPTASGSPAAIVDGWMLALTTADAQQQNGALRFLTWMADGERQGAYSQALGVVPAQTDARQAWEDDEYMALIEVLLERAALPLDDDAQARALQTALVVILSGQSSADEAMESLLAQVDG